MMSMSPIVGVGVILTDAEDRVLLGRRIAGTEAGTWSLPGGKVDHCGETFEEAGSRELVEETGIVMPANALNIVGVLLDYPDSRTRVTAVAVGQGKELSATVTEPEVFACWRLFAFDALPKPLYPPTAAAIAVARPRDAHQILQRSEKATGVLSHFSSYRIGG